MAKERDFDKFAGNKYSLRAKYEHTIKRIDDISKSLCVLGHFCVPTWLAIAMSAVRLGAGAFMIVHRIKANGFATFVPIIPAIALILVGSLLISINVLMTNPSMGSQFIVSMKFV